ncbi:hypothetical protein [Zymobacter sp. IVIA_5232.4 C2]|uniref:hypothetical protein n=1 Tax=Zymobacter sp. IVIA_5232.4 C2 TaxID=3394855 RepID=UPI0039C45717
MLRHTLYPNARHALCGILCLLSCSGCSLLHPAPSPAASTAAQAWIAVGQEYLVEGDIGGARQAFDHARRFDEAQPTLWHGLALCAQLEHDRPLAHERYQRALALAERRARDTHEADDSDRDREYVALLNNHARLLYDEGAIREACAEFDRAARYPAGIGNPMTAQNLTLCHTISVAPSPL